MSLTNVLLLVVLVLLIWSNRDQIPHEYQFWKKEHQAELKVQNNSDQDIQDVVIDVWGVPYAFGNIPKGGTKDMTITSGLGPSDAHIRFLYGKDVVAYDAGTIDDQSHQLAVSIHFAGIITSKTGVGVELGQPAVH